MNIDYPFLTIQSHEDHDPLNGFPDLLNTDDLARLTGLSTQTLREQLASGRLPGRKIGRRWFVSKARFLEFMGSAQ